MNPTIRFRQSVFSTLIFAVSLTGCNDSLTPGHYEGNWLQKTGDQWQQEPVQIELSPSGKTAFFLSALNRQGVERLSASFHVLKNKQIEVRSEYLGTDPILADPIDRSRVDGIEQDKSTHCFKSAGTKSFEFCHKTASFLLRIFDHPSGSVMELSGNFFQREEDFKLEASVQLSLSESVKLAFQQNFDSKIGYQHVIQAKWDAMSAYLNLVPHLTTNLIWNAAPNYITYLATLQGLVPFILPSYWLQAQEATIEKEIQDAALLIMRANLASSVEELTYALTRDQAIILDQQNYLLEIQDFRSKLNDQPLTEESKLLLIELADFMIEALTSDIGDMTKLIKQDRYSIAQTLGFHNLDAVTGVSIDQENLTLDRAVQVDPHEMAKQASQRAFEIKQLDDLKRIAKLKKIENYFVWMDPAGDPKQGLGLNTFPTQKKMKSQILELEIQREQTKTNVYQNAYKLALGYNEAIESYRTINGDLDSCRPKFNNLINDAIAGKPVHSDHLKWMAQKYGASLVARHVTLANFRIARAKKDRFLLAGYYSQILPRLYQEVRTWSHL